jgi:hypothetical protein
MATAIKLAQAVGITGSALLSGNSFSASFLSIPPLLKLPPSTSTPIFSYVYHQGALAVIPVSIISAIANGYLAYASHTPESTRLYATAAASVLATLPWTALVMMKGITRLNGLAESKVEQEKADRSEVEGLLNGWKLQNYVRSVLFLTGAIFSAMATLG